jgi:hypothetical protein
MTRKEIEETRRYRASEAYRAKLAEDAARRGANWQEVIEFKQFGLSCISPKTNPNLLSCDGITVNGESLQFDCEEGLWAAVEMGRCRVERYSPEEGYFAYYEYAKGLLPHWREIDVGVFAKLNSWEQK